MAPNAKEDIKWSGDRMEGGDVLRTMECLRRRLLAERQASLRAKEEAELMGKRSKELENQIREQIEMRRKAEKKLESLRKKLASLNLTSTLLNSELSVSPEMPAGVENSHVEESPNARDCADSSSSPSETCCKEPSKSEVEIDGEKSISVDDSLALVAVSLPEKSVTGELKPADGRTIEVLNELKRARERIQSSVEISKLSMIRVNPI